MPDRHWENLKEIFHAATALPLNERDAYLDKACDGDQALRTAVAALLKSHEETGNFVDTPAHHAAAEMLADGVTLKAAQMITHYRILSLLGEGGMGKVYLAEDTKLHRRVAIKFLPGDSIGNHQANKRLLREAQAVAKLDHANICAVHEVNEADNRIFIVMPFVEGETLDVRMRRKGLELSETLAIAAQVADALADAHAAGIIHRDIKPSNIIVTPRGQAKVMDFGLAKSSELPMGSGGPKSDPEASTQVLLTTPGTIIGTVPYMSPEQVHGQRLDTRTDIFSFGTVVYEMLTGLQPFAAESPAGTISAILTREPAPVSEYLKSCPAELQRIVTRCLAKIVNAVIRQSEGHFGRGFLLWTHANRFPHEQAIQAYKRAIALNPNLGEAHHQLGLIYFHIGLLDKGEDEIKKALAINPSDTLARFRLGSINVNRGKFEEALAVLKTVPREADPAIVDRTTAVALFQLGRIQEASDIVDGYLKTYATDEGGNVTSVKAMILAKYGNEREAEKTIQHAIDIGRGFTHFHHTTYNVASAYALLDKADEAVTWLQYTADHRFPCYPLFENDANLNSLRKDERFIAFMSKLKQQWQRYQANV